MADFNINRAEPVAALRSSVAVAGKPPIERKVEGQAFAAEGSGANSRAGAIQRELERPYVAEAAAGRARQSQAAGTAAGLKVEQARIAQRQAAQKEVEAAKKLASVTDRILKNPTFPDIIGRRINPIYGMFGHNDPASESPEAGWPRLLWGGSQAANLVSDVDFLQKQAAMAGRASLRPDPQIGQQEQKMAGASQVNLNWDQSPAAFAENARKFRDEKIRLANKYLFNQEAERRRSLKEGIVPSSTFKDGDVAKDANGVRAVFKKGQWVELP